MNKTTLFRPVGKKELELIQESNFKKYPPRLVGQPIFYPVLNYEYAAQIAKEWNTEDEFSGYCGFVTQFEIDTAYISKFKVETVGTSMHQELWVLAEELEEFNAHIIGKIEVTGAFYGEKFVGKKQY